MPASSIICPPQAAPWPTGPLVAGPAGCGSPLGPGGPGGGSGGPGGGSTGPGAMCCANGNPPAPGAQQPCGGAGGGEIGIFNLYKPPFIGGSASGSGPTLPAHFTVDLTGIGPNEKVVAVRGFYTVGGSPGNFTLQDTGVPGGAPLNQSTLTWTPDGVRELGADLANVAFPVDLVLTFDGPNATLAVSDFTVSTVKIF